MSRIETFEGWLQDQQIDGQSLTEDQTAQLRAAYELCRKISDANDPTDTVSRPPPPGEFRNAVAIQDEFGLWLTLWVKRSRRGEYFVCYPRGTGGGDPHASYHLDGKYHQKSHGLKSMVQERQPLKSFRGCEHLGMFAGHGPGFSVCNPSAFTAVLRVPAGILTGRSGCVLVDLVEPDCLPAPHHRNLPGLTIVTEETYREASPWLVIAAAKTITGTDTEAG